MTRLFPMLLGLCAMFLVACSGEKTTIEEASKATAEQEMPTMAFAEFVSPADSLPHLKFFSGDQVSLNDRCPVRKVRLNPKMGASYVNGQPVGFC